MTEPSRDSYSPFAVGARVADRSSKRGSDATVVLGPDVAGNIVIRTDDGRWWVTNPEYLREAP